MNILVYIFPPHIMGSKHSKGTRAELLLKMYELEMLHSVLMRMYVNQLKSMKAELDSLNSKISTIERRTLAYANSILEHAEISKCYHTISMSFIYLQRKIANNECDLNLIKQKSACNPENFNYHEACVQLVRMRIDTASSYGL